MRTLVLVLAGALSGPEQMIQRVDAKTQLVEMVVAVQHGPPTIQLQFNLQQLIAVRKTHSCVEVDQVLDVASTSTSPETVASQQGREIIKKKCVPDCDSNLQMN